MSPAVVLVWYVVVAGPQGGMTLLPSYFDKREQCEVALTEYAKKPTTGWSVQCVPAASPYPDDMGTDEAPAEQ